MTYPFLPDISKTSIDQLQLALIVYRKQLVYTEQVLMSNPGDWDYSAARTRLEDLIEHFRKGLRAALDREHNTQPL